MAVVGRTIDVQSAIAETGLYLTHLDTIKTHLDLIGQSSFDDTLRNLNAQASAMIAAHCGRQFHHQRYDPESTPEFSIYSMSDKDTRSMLVLEQYPVTDLISVISDNMEVDLDDIRIGKTRRALYYESGRDYSARLDGYVGTFGREVKVTYEAGYREIPQDLQLATCMLVSYLWNKRGKEGVKSEGDPVSHNTIDYLNMPMPTTVKLILQKYVKVSP